MRIAVVVFFTASILLSAPGWATDTEAPKPDREVLWQTESPTCFDPDLPLGDQLETMNRFLVGGEITEPKKIAGRLPSVEERFRMSQAGARPVVEFLVSEDGRVELVLPAREVASESDRIMAGVVSEWEFEPATVGGKPVCVLYTVSSTISY